MVLDAGFGFGSAVAASLVVLALWVSFWHSVIVFPGTAQHHRYPALGAHVHGERGQHQTITGYTHPPVGSGSRADGEGAAIGVEGAGDAPQLHKQAVAWSERDLEQPFIEEIDGHAVVDDGAEDWTCRGQRRVPWLIIIGAQKGGTSSLFRDLVGWSSGSIDSACKTTSNDTKECNSFHNHRHVNQTDLGYLFCTSSSTTRNYCMRLRARQAKAAAFFHTRYDACPPPASVESESSFSVASSFTVQIPQATAQRVVLPMDASPTYSCRPHVPGAIKLTYGEQDASKLRFIFSLRNPVNRTISYFNHAVDSNWANLKKRYVREPGFGFSVWLDETISTITNCTNHLGPDRAWPDCGILGMNAAMYALQLEHWLRYFSPRQFCILDFEHFKRSHSAVMASLFRFITPGHPKVDAPLTSSASSSSSSFITPSHSSSSTRPKGGIITWDPVLSGKRSKHAAFSAKSFDQASACDVARLEDFWAFPNQQLRELLQRYSGQMNFAPVQFDPGQLFPASMSRSQGAQGRYSGCPAPRPDTNSGGGASLGGA